MVYSLNPFVLIDFVQTGLRMNLTDRQWHWIGHLFVTPGSVTQRGRPRKNARLVFSSILWILKTGSPWRDLPSNFPPFQTCHRWFQNWTSDGTLLLALKWLVAESSRQAPHKQNRRKKKTQDGRTLRRYKRRWKVERHFAWLQNYRRIVTRYEYKSENFMGMVLLACIMIVLNHYIRQVSG